MKKILVFQEKIPHYRIDLFNEISNRPNIKLTIVYTIGNIDLNKINFNVIKLPVFRIGSFKHAKGFLSLCKNADQIILMFDLRWLNVYQCLYSEFRKKITLWGIGISTEKGLRKKRHLDKLRFWIVSKYKGIILYSNYVANYYLESGVNKNKVFVANNTLKIMNNFQLERVAKDLLFIGTVNKRKGLDRLIVAFSNIIPQIDANVNLNIIGEGDMLNEYKQIVKDLRMNKRIKFHGKIQSQEKLMDFFSSSIISISLEQAGLSILHSFAFGIPFMCFNDAINGGEVENISHKINGYITSLDNLEKDLIFVINSKSLLKTMSQNSYNHYWNSRTIEHFTNDYLKALN